MARMSFRSQRTGREEPRTRSYAMDRMAPSFRIARSTTWIGVTGKKPNTRMACRDEEHDPDRLGDPVDRVVLHPLEHLAGPVDGVDDRGQPGRQQHDVGRRPRRVRGAGDGDAGVGSLQRRDVVHPIPGHPHDVAEALQHLARSGTCPPGRPARTRPPPRPPGPSSSPSPSPKRVGPQDLIAHADHRGDLLGRSPPGPRSPS